MWVLLGLLALLALGLAALPFAIPWYAGTDHARDLIRELSRESGVEVDYERLTFDPLEGVFRLEGLRLPSPPPYDAVAPDWLSVEKLEMVWSASDLFAGRVHVRHLHVEGVRVHAVIDEEGESSIEAALAGLEDDEATEEPEAPLSRTLADLDLPAPVRVDELRVSDVRLEMTELLEGGGREHTSLDGLELHGSLARDDAPLEAELVLRSPERAEGTRVSLTSPEGESEIDLSARFRVATAGEESVHLEARVDLLRQTMDEALVASGNVLELEAEVDFEPAQQTTRLTLTRFALLEDAARAELVVALHDEGIFPSVERGEAYVELDPIVAAAPSLFEGIEAPGARATLRVHPPGRDGSLARLELEAEAPRFAMTSESDAFSLEGLTLTLNGEVGAKVSALEGALEIGPIEARSGGDRFRVSGAEATLRVAELTPDLSRPARFEIDGALPRVEAKTAEGERSTFESLGFIVKGELRSQTELDVNAEIALGSMKSVAGGATTALHDVTLALGLTDARVDTDDALASRADVELALRVGRVETREDDARLRVTGLDFTLAGPYRGAMPSTFRGALGLSGVFMREGDAREIRVISPGRLRYSITDLAIDQDAPLASSGAFHAEGRFPPFLVDLDGKLADGDGDLSFHLRTKTLSAILELLELAPPEGVEVDETGFDMRIKGRFRGLLSASPKLDQTLTATLTNLMLHETGLEVVIPKVGLVLEHRGEGAVHHGALRVDLERPEMNGQRFDEPITLRAEGRADLAKLTGRVEGKLAGPEALAGSLNLEASVDARGKVSHEERFTIEKLGVLAAVIPLSTLEEHPVDLSSVALSLEGSGTLAGALTPDRAGLIERWEAESHIEQTMSASLRGVRYTPPGLNVELPEARFDLDLESDPAGSKAEAKLTIPRLDVEDVGNHHITIHDLEQNLHLRAEGALAERRLVIETDGGITRMEQDMLPAYPAEDLALSFRLVMDGFESMELERFALENPRGGTKLEMTKSLGRSGARRSDGSRVRGAQHFALRGNITQDLGKLDVSPGTFRGRGVVTGPFSLDSADGSLFRIRAALKTQKVDVDMPELGLHIEGLRGNVPLEEAIEWDPEIGVIVVPSTGRSAFSRVRFQDVQHSLSSDAFLEITKLRYGDVELGPMRGSMRVDRNVFYIDGIRIEKDEALITGQVVVDYVPGAERISFRGNVTGLRPEGSNDPLDANAAIVFDPNRLDLDGRIQIVRIGRKHLRQLIDLVDPYGEDGSLNTLRRALKLGYPKRVGIRLSEGLMSMNVSLGGVLGSLIRIGEIPGIALGPFMTQHVAPLMPQGDTSE